MRNSFLTHQVMPSLKRGSSAKRLRAMPMKSAMTIAGSEKPPVSRFINGSASTAATATPADNATPAPFLRMNSVAAACMQSVRPRADAVRHRRSLRPNEGLRQWRFWPAGQRPIRTS